MNARRHLPLSAGVAAGALLLAAVLQPAVLVAGDEALTLRVNDGDARPGGVAAVVLRTYAPRGVGQGQICLSHRAARRGAAAGPFVDLEEVRVFSDEGDAIVDSSFDAATQTALVAFDSLSASVNGSDGPLAVFFFRLADTVTPGEEIALGLDLPATFLIDAFGAGIPLVERGGTLTVRAPGVPYELAADGDRVAPGEVAVLGVETAEPLAVGSGQVVVLYDPAVAAGEPSVTMDPRHGTSAFSVDSQVAGRLVVSFASIDGSLGGVPGQLVSIALPVPAVDAFSTVSLDPVLTRLEDPLGAPIPVSLAAGVLEVGAGGTVFADGFESGDSARWALSAP